MLYCMSVPIYFFVQAFKNIDYLGSTKISFHKQFVLECKGCLIALKDRLEEDCACFELLFYHERQSPRCNFPSFFRIVTRVATSLLCTIDLFMGTYFPSLKLRR